MWIDIAEDDEEAFDCCLSLGENSSMVRWIHLSNFDIEDQLVHEEAVRHLEKICTDAERFACSQHFKGMWNVVSNSLEHNHHAPSSTLTSLLRITCPSQMPMSFRMLEMPREIESWVCRTLHLSSKSVLDPKEWKTSTIGAAFVGVDFSKAIKYQ